MDFTMPYDYRSRVVICAIGVCGGRVTRCDIRTAVVDDLWYL